MRRVIVSLVVAVFAGGCHHRPVEQQQVDVMKRLPQIQGALATTFQIFLDDFTKTYSPTEPFCVGFRKLHGFWYVYDPQRGILDRLHAPSGVYRIGSCPAVFYNSPTQQPRGPYRVLITDEKYYGDDYADLRILVQQGSTEWHYRCWGDRHRSEWAISCRPLVMVFLM
jgi:hypothetical protein